MIIIDHRFIGRGRVRAVSCVCGFSIFVPADDIGRSRKHLGRLFRHLSFFSFMGQQVRVATSTDSPQCDAVCVSLPRVVSLFPSAHKKKRGRLSSAVAGQLSRATAAQPVGRSVGGFFLLLPRRIPCVRLASSWDGPSPDNVVLVNLISVKTKSGTADAVQNLQVTCVCVSPPFPAHVFRIGAVVSF